MNLRDIRYEIAHGRWLYVLAAGAAAAATVGFFTGTRGEPAPHGLAEAVPEDEVAEERPLAPTYAEMGDVRRGHNRNRHAAALEHMRSLHPLQTDPVELSEEAKLEALELRAQRRAFSGAPPQIPHPIDQMQTQECAACHWEGIRVESRVGNPMSHGMHASCTQCHVVSDGPVPGPALEGGPPMENSFAGLEAPRGGEAAWPGAPPVIPHRTNMRERCESCHGVWATGIRSSHPWRQSCTQCHAPDAELDQRPEGLPDGTSAPWLAEAR